MRIPDKTYAKIMARFDSLNAEGAEVLKTISGTPAILSANGIILQPGVRSVNWPQFVEWCTKTTTLLCIVLPKGNVHRTSAEALPKLPATYENMEWGLSLLKGIKSDLENGLLDDFAAQIEAEIAADYMGQAEQLLRDGQTGKFDHVPAAILSGAVLEKTLRQLCIQQQPPIALLNGSGEPKTLEPLIDGLKKAGLFNELQAKQLRVWAGIRNRAAHGEFDQFARRDVEQMIAGIAHFIREYLK